MFISWIFRQHLFCTFCLEIGTAIIPQIITKLYAMPRIIDLTFQKDLFTRTKVIAQLQLNNEYRYRVKSVSNEQLQKLIFVLRHDKIIKISNSFFFSKYPGFEFIQGFIHLRQPRVTIRVPLLSTLGGSKIHFEIRAQCHLVIY